MPREKLVSLGLTDEQLDGLYVELLGRDLTENGLDPDAADTEAMQRLRRRYFDAVMRQLYAPTDAPPEREEGSDATDPTIKLA